jgi:ferredoxin, 2Fe-2S
MPKLSFIRSDSTRKEVEIAVGESAMIGALLNNVDGILGECGGSAVCGTCHVYVDDAYIAMLPKMTANEDALLDSTSEPRAEASRLSCQIIMTSELDGLIVRIPDSQT